MFKLSRYLESVDFYDQDRSENMTLVYSTRSSQCIVIDVNSWEKINSNMLADLSEDILKKLINLKLLVEENEDELNTILQENTEALETTPLLYFSIQPSANCSFGCDYCGQKHENTLLSEKYQEKLISHIKNKKNNYHKALSICWFGAEPLTGIKVIRTLSPKLQQFANESGLAYSAKVVTNGISLTEDICDELVNVFAVKKIEITIDGTKEFHDKRRHTKQGQGTFDKIYSNLLHLMNHYSDQIEVSLRCNVDDRNKENMPDFIDMLSKDGVFDKCNFYFAPIHSWGNDAHKLVENKENWAQNQIGWFIQLREKGAKLKLLPERVKNLCMAVSKDAGLIDPYGNLFKCSEVSLVPYYVKNGKNIHLMGHVSDEKSLLPASENQFGKFYNRNVIEDFPCSKCPLLPVCGGMCPKEWMEGRNACPPMKFNFKERLLLNYIWSKETNKRLKDAEGCNV